MLVTICPQGTSLGVLTLMFPLLSLVAVVVFTSELPGLTGTKTSTLTFLSPTDNVQFLLGSHPKANTAKNNIAVIILYFINRSSPCTSKSMEAIFNNLMIFDFPSCF